MSIGDKIESGSEVAIVETLKTSLGIEAKTGGFVREIHGEVGSEIGVSQLLFVIADSMEEEIPNVPAEERQTSKPSHQRDFAATLKARELAVARGIDLKKISPKDGSTIKSEDVLAAVESRSIEKATNFKERKLTNPEKGMLKSLEFQKNEAIPCYLEKIVDIGPLLERATDMKKEKSFVFTPLFALLSYQFVQVLKLKPDLNSFVKGDSVFTNEQIHLGFTVDVEGDLYLAVVRDAGKLNEVEFVERVFEIQHKATKRELSVEESSGATVGITSLAAFGISMHQPILLPNTSMMIAHSGLLPNIGNGTQTIFGMTYDHRLHNGVKMAKFLKALEASLA